MKAKLNYWIDDLMFEVKFFYFMFPKENWTFYTYLFYCYKDFLNQPLFFFFFLKVVEIAPAFQLDPHLRNRLHTDAVNLAKMVHFLFFCLANSSSGFCCSFFSSYCRCFTGWLSECERTGECSISYWTWETDHSNWKHFRWILVVVWATSQCHSFFCL